MNHDKTLTRRSFIQQLGLLGTVGLGAGSLLSACGGDAPSDRPPEDVDMPAGSETGAIAPEPNTAASTLDCTDTSNLTEQEIQLRESLNYTDNSPHAEKVCSNCQFWRPPAQEGQCGGCQILKGPIHPQGYCDSWAAKQA